MNNLPILSHINILDSLTSLGIKKKPIMSVRSADSVYESLLTEEQKGQLKYAPRNEVVRLEGDDNLWFRSKGKDWATAFVLLPGDMILLTAEYVTGADIVSIVPCAGVPETGESMAEAAVREVREESGVVLESVHPLSIGGLPVSARRLTTRVHPFIGFPKLDSEGKPVFAPLAPDEDEDILPFLMSLPDYWEFLSENYDNALVARDCAYAALRYLGRIRLL